MKPSGNTILITGGGSGIGAAMAHRFHDAGNTVVVAGRRLDALEAAIAGRDRMDALAVDMEDADSIATLVRRAIAKHPDLNVLVNNAGIMRNEHLDRARDLGDAEATIATNLIGPIRLIDAVVDHLSTRPDAAIINVSSGLAFVPSVAAPTYAATKAAIHSYTVALRVALKGKVEVVELVPPAVQTGLTPGQKTRAGYMPLDAFVDEAMTVLRQQPTPAEILVERARPLRWAEAEGRLDAMVTALHDAARRSLVQN